MNNVNTFSDEVLASYLAMGSAIAGSMLVVAFMLLSFRIGVITFRSFTEGDLFDFLSLSKYVAFVIAIAYYSEIMGMVSLFFAGLTSAVPANEVGFVEGIGMAFDASMGAVNQVFNPSENNEDGILQRVQNAFYAVGNNFYSTAWSLMSQSITTIVRFILEYMRAFLIGFLYATGPIAIVISMIPSLENTLKKWFSAYTSIQLWAITMSILDSLVGIYFEKSLHYGQSVDGQYIEATAIYPLGNMTRLIDYVVITILYLMVPYLTTLYAGHSSVGQFLSKATALAAGIATKGMAGHSKLGQMMPQGNGGVISAAPPKGRIDPVSGLRQDYKASK